MLINVSTLNCLSQYRVIEKESGILQLNILVNSKHIIMMVILERAKTQSSPVPSHACVAVTVYAHY
jgi:hypothetical protein